MSWEFKSASEFFPSFTAEWGRLNARLYGAHPLFDSRFIGSLLEYFGQGNELLCLHRSDETTDGALILRPLGLGRWALFLPAQLQAGAVMLEDARLLESLLPSLPGHAWNLDLLAIDPLYAPDWTRLRLPRLVVPHTNTMAISTQGSFADYWQTRPKSLIKNIHRYKRRAEEKYGALSVAIHTQADSIIAALARYGRLESAGWKGKAGTAITSDNPQGRFYADMLARFAQSGQARVMELYAGERLVASRLLIGHATMWIALKTTYDETLATIAPGRLLLHSMIERAFNEMPNGNIEFYTNVSRDQSEWATAIRPISHHQITRHETAALLLGLYKSVRQAQHRKKAPNSQDYDPLTIHSYPNIAAIPSSARTLFDQAEAQYPEFSPCWFDNLQRAVYPEDPGVHYYVASRASRPVAILPLRFARYGMVKRIEALGNFYTSLYGPLLSEDATELDLAALLQAASRDYGGVHEMRFAPMDPEDRAYTALLAALRSSGWMPFCYFCFGNWYHDIDGNWEAYLERRPGELRSTIRRKSKKFTAAGGTLEIVMSSMLAERAIQDFNQIYSHSWKKPEPYAEFIPGLIRWLAAKGWLRLGIARLGEKPIAAQIWIVADRKAYIFKLAHDREFADYAAGTLLTAHLLEHVIDREGVLTVDYLIGDDEYKKKWMDSRRERWGIVAYNPQRIIGVSLLAKEITVRGLRKVTA